MVIFPFRNVSCRFLVRVSYMEIYNEEIRDLLEKISTEKGGPTNLEIKVRTATVTISTLDPGGLFLMDGLL